MAREMRESCVEWLGTIPQGWGLQQAGQVLHQVKCKNDGMVETNLLSLSYGKVKRRDIDAKGGLLPESFEGYNIVEDGDIVLRFTDLQNDQRGLRTGLVTERGIITSAYTTVRPVDLRMSRYLHYALHAYDLRKGFYGMGSGVRQGLKWQEAKYILLPCPEADEQQRIADYLDDRCAEIDRAIEAAERSIEEYEELRRSYVTEMVRHRAGWHKTRLSHVCTRVFDGPFGSNLKSKDYVDDGVFVVRLENLRYLWFNAEKRSFVTQEKYETISAHTVFPGDLIMSTFIADCIKVCEMPEIVEYAVNKADCIGIRPKEPSDASWIKYCLASMDTFNYLSGLIHGTTRPRVNTTQIRSIPISMPDGGTREGIVTTLDESNSAIDSVIAAKQSIIEDLKAYKQSLIYEVVTGKREV